MEGPMWGKERGRRGEKHREENWTIGHEERENTRARDKQS